MEYREDMTHEEYVVFITEERRREVEHKAALHADHLECFPEGTSLFVDKHCVILRGPSIAESRLRGLDKDSLAPLVLSREMLTTGYHKVGEYLLVPHPVLRRSFCCKSALNTDLIGALLSLGKLHGVQPLIRFDNDALGIADSLEMCLEHDYWRGPRVGKDLRGLTTEVVVHRHLEDDPRRNLSGIDRVEFHLTASDDSGIRSIRMEEVHTTPIGPRWEEGEEPGEAVERFMHGDLAPDGKVTHLDGAYRGYTSDRWWERVACDIKHHGRQGVYEKLFKINAPLSQEEFADIACKFFWTNPLMPEMLQTLLADDDSSERR